MNREQTIAKALLKIGAVGFSVKEPVTFTSGMKSPVYVDNRKFPFWPEEWKLVIEGFEEKVREQGIDAEVLAGIETAGIPHSSALGYLLGIPSVFIRKKPKEHGTKNRVEGGDVRGKRVLLIEDLVTTGGSSLAGVEALREEGATVDDCLIIVTYGFPEAREAFEKAQVRLHALTSFPTILAEALAAGKLSPEDKRSVEDWLEDPYGWAKKYGFEQA